MEVGRKGLLGIQNPYIWFKRALFSFTFSYLRSQQGSMMTRPMSKVAALALVVMSSPLASGFHQRQLFLLRRRAALSERLPLIAAKKGFGKEVRRASRWRTRLVSLMLCSQNATGRSDAVAPRLSHVLLRGSSGGVLVPLLTPPSTPPPDDAAAAFAAPFYSHPHRPKATLTCRRRRRRRAPPAAPPSVVPSPTSATR